ncbi:ROK family protein [Dehalococcoidia bacterium]|nr:ROK family protein [Dehalococcoidia bacterium]
MKEYLAGFDIGGTKLSLVIADQSGMITERLREETDIASDHFTDYRDGLAYLGLGDQMRRMLGQGLQKVRADPCVCPGGYEQADIKGEHVGSPVLAAIGIGSAGPLKDGDMRNPTNINLLNLPGDAADKPLYIPLVGPLEEEFNVPIRLENDCGAAVLGEVHYGAGKKVEDKSRLHLVYVTISTGIGAGVWDRGHLLYGKHGNAAEVGHFFVKEAGLKCGCGNYGCAEAYCSGNGIAKNARMRLVNENLRPEDGSVIIRLAREKAISVQSPGSNVQSLRPSSLDTGPSDWELLEFVTAPLVFQSAAEGDALAQAVIGEAIRYGGIVLAGIANAYDPQVISVGGALALENPTILEPMREEMLKHLNVEPPELRLTELGDEAVLLGALALAREALEEPG